MRDQEAWLATVDRGVERGLADAEAGRTKTLDDARAILSERFGTADR